MRKTYYIVEIEVEDLLRELVVVHPNLDISEESRTLDEVMAAAMDKDYEVGYCSSFYGASAQRFEEIRKVCVRWVRSRLEIRSEWDVQLDVKARVTMWEK